MPNEIIKVSSLSIFPISKSEFAISWEFEPTFLSFDNFKFSLEKSNAPHDGYEFLASISPKSKTYIDSDVAIFKFWKSYYVRMRIINASTNESYVSEPATVEHPPNLEAIELIRRGKISLENPRYGNGVPCKVFIRKEGGQRCTECFDVIKRRSTKTNCVNCYGTSYDGGFYKAIDAYFNFSVDVKTMGVSDIGNATRSGNRAITCNYPILKPGDVIADTRLNRIWTVSGEVQTIERRRHVIKQILSLEEEDRTSVLFELLLRGDF